MKRIVLSIVFGKYKRRAKFPLYHSRAYLSFHPHSFHKIQRRKQDKKDNTKPFSLNCQLRKKEIKQKKGKMAVSSGVFATTFLSPETASSFLKPSSSGKPGQFSPVHLRTVRTVTLATASPKPVTGKREPRGIMKPRRVSPEMEAFVGAPEIPRTQALKLIWAHIKQHNLQVFFFFVMKLNFLYVLFYLGFSFRIRFCLVY